MMRLSTIDPGFPNAFDALLHQARETTEQVDRPVAAIIAEVRAHGDAALIDYTPRVDHVTLSAETLRTTAAEIDAAVSTVPAEQLAALDLAATRIEAFH